MSQAVYYIWLSLVYSGELLYVFPRGQKEERAWGLGIKSTAAKTVQNA